MLTTLAGEEVAGVSCHDHYPGRLSGARAAYRPLAEDLGPYPPTKSSVARLLSTVGLDQLNDVDYLGCREMNDDFAHTVSGIEQRNRCSPVVAHAKY